MSLYRKGVPLESIERREPSAFEALIQSTREVEMYGPTGYFRFYNNTGGQDLTSLSQALHSQHEEQPPVNNHP
eukprot:4533878-Amphidinium_carterae.1